MNKYFKLTFLVCFLWGMTLKAQLPSQYTFTKTTGVFTDISGTGTAGPSGDDVISGVFTIGFPFNLCGTTYNAFKISTNGFLTFDQSLANSGVTNALNGTPAPVLAPLWDDLNTGNTYYQLSGTAGSQVLTIQWSNVKWRYSGNPNFSFQVKMYEGSDDIEFIYGDSLGVNNTPTASIGFNSAANVFLSVDPVSSTTSSVTEYASITTWPGLNTVYRFQKPTGDFTPPVISNATASPSGFSCTATAKTISAQITDNVGVTSAYFTYTVNGGPSTQVNMTPGGGSYSGTVPAILGNIVVTIYASDAANNVSTQVIAYTNGGAGVDAGLDQTINIGTSATLVAYTRSGVSLKMTEITQYASGTGKTTTYPAYMSAITSGTQDFIELTNLGPIGVDLSGMKIELYKTTILQYAYTFPNGTKLNSGSVLVLFLGIGTNIPASNFYNSGTSIDNSSNEAVGYVLKTPGGGIIDAVATNGYTFPVISQVTATDWTGTVASSSGFAGITRNLSDNNNASDWSVCSATVPQTIASFNVGLTMTNSPSIVWTPGNVANDTLVTGNLNVTTTFVATVDDGTCTMTDTVIVNTIVPTAPVADFTASAVNVSTGTVVTLTDLSTNVPSGWSWSITPATFTYVNGTSATTQNPQVTFTAAGAYTVALTASNPAGSNTVTKNNYINVILSYCNSGATNTADTDIGQVVIDTFSNGSATPITNNPLANGTYSDYTNLGPVTLAQNNTYNFSMSQITAGATFYAARLNVFIDFNQDGVFSLSENIYTGVTVSGTTTTLSGSFLVPATANLGLTRIRFILKEGGTATDSSCGTYSYGETEDYLLNIVTSGICANPPSGGTISGPASTPYATAAAFSTTGSVGTVIWQYSTNNGTTWQTQSGNGTSTNLLFNTLGTIFIRTIATSPNCPADTSTTFSILVTPNQGDLITNPWIITGNGYTHTDSTSRYTSDYTGPNAQTSPDIYYRYVVPTCLDSVTFSLCSSTFGSDTYIHLIKADGTHITSDDDGCGTFAGYSKITASGLTVGDTLYLVVEGYGLGNGTKYTLTVNESLATPPTFTPIADIHACGLVNVCATTSVGPNDITWSNGDTGTCTTITVPGTYIVTMGTGACAAIDTFVVFFDTVSAQFNAPDSVFKDSVVTFTADSAGLTYTWSFGPTATPDSAHTATATTQFNTPGTATITLITSNGICSDTVTKTISVLLVTSIENTWNNTISVYPNPNTGQFIWSLDLAQKETVRFEVSDLTGKLVFEQEVTGKHIQETVKLPVSSGVYLWKAIGKSGFSAGKLVVE